MTSDDTTKHDITLTQIDLDHLHDGAPVYKPLDDDLLVIRAAAEVWMEDEEDRITYLDANESYCHTCEKTIPNAHVRYHAHEDS